ICGAKVSSWSSVTPRSRTTGEKIKWGKSAAMAERSSFASCCRVPNQINWVFDGLSLKRLVDIQVTQNRSGSEKRAYLGGVNDVKKRTQNRTLRKTIGGRDPCGSRGPMDHAKGALTEK